MEAVLVEDRGCGKHHEASGLNRPDLQICFSMPAVAATCKGDEGRPLVYKVNGIVECLIGIAASHNGERCEHPDYPSDFTAATPFQRWMWRAGKYLHSNPQQLFD